MTPQNDVKAMSHLESKVATLETELRQVVKTVGELATGMQEFSKRVETQIQSLAISVERVAAPKQTNWTALVGTGVSVGMAIITIGALVLWPMGREIDRLHAWHEKHEALELHPVGAEKIEKQEKHLIDASERNRRAILDLEERAWKRADEVHAAIGERISGVQKAVDLVAEEGSPHLRARLAVLEYIAKDQEERRKKE